MRVGPGRIVTVVDPLGRMGTEHGEAGYVGTEQVGAPRLLCNEPSKRRKQLERGGHDAPERVGRATGGGTISGATGRPRMPTPARLTVLHRALTCGSGRPTDSALRESRLVASTTPVPVNARFGSTPQSTPEEMGA